MTGPGRTLALLLGLALLAVSLLAAVLTLAPRLLALVAVYGLVSWSGGVVFRELLLRRAGR